MPRYWVVRTNVNVVSEVIVPSLDAGELRQGWGYRDDQDLNVIGPIINAEGRSALNDDQKATWRRVQRFWDGHWDPVTEGDLIVLPKVPGWGRWTLVEVTGSYRFERHPVYGDYGHILPVRTLIADIASSNRAVGAGLQRTMRNQGPMWNIDGLAEEVQRLLLAQADLAIADTATERLKDILDETLDGLREGLRQGFRATQLEEPVRRLLVQVFPDARIEKHAGPAEHGADFLLIETDRFNHERATVVQLKDHEDVLNEYRALEQVADAYGHYEGVTAAVILTTADREDAAFATAREALSERLGIPVSTVLGPTLARWFLANLEAVAAD